MEFGNAMKINDKPGSCCAPTAPREPAVSPAGALFTQTTATHEAASDAHRAMVALPGGTFLMGTNYDRGFPADGEGPVVRFPGLLTTYPPVSYTHLDVYKRQ